MILLDTSGLLAAMFKDQNQHEACARALRDAEPSRIMSPFVLTELDYMIVKFAGVGAEIKFLNEILGSVYEVAPWTVDDLISAHEVIRRYEALRIGLADASTVVLAEKYGIYDILTLDERHFRAMRPEGRKKGFRLLPADASPSAGTTKTAARSLRP